LNSVGLTRQRLAALAERAHASRIGRIALKLLGQRKKPQHAGLRVYTFQPAQVAAPTGDPPLAKNCLSDLLTLDSADGRPGLQRFLAQSLKQIESGSHVYTCVADGRLIYSGWLVEQQEKVAFLESCQDMPLPPGSAALFDFDTHQQARSTGFYEDCLRQMLHHAGSAPGAKALYVLVRENDFLTQQAVERLGGVCQCRPQHPALTRPAGVGVNGTCEC
jgi:hypothetical protein